MNFSTVTAYIDSLVKEKKLPLLEVIAYKNHERLYSYFGSSSDMHSEGERLCMFSCTKVMTAVCVMRLIEEGKIALDAPVSNYIPAFEGAYTLDENGKRHSEVITVRHLLTMSSGMDYALDCPEITKIKENSIDTATTREVIEGFLKRPLCFSPGKRFLYGLSHDALGVLVEAVTGMTLSDYMEKQVFKPLGMKSSALSKFKNEDTLPINYAITKNGFEVQENNSYLAFHPIKNYVSGGAGLISSARDYAIFADALASGGVSEGGYRLLLPESIEKLKEAHFYCADKESCFSCFQGKEYAYGLGVRVRTEPHECGISKGEFGWDGAAGSFVMIDTDNNISLTIGMNIINWFTLMPKIHIDIAKAIYEAII